MLKKKFWEKAIKDKSYGIRGHKLFAILSYVDKMGVVSFTQLNKFSYNYTRRCKKNKYYTGIKYDKNLNRGYMCCNLYYGGYIGRYLFKTYYPGIYVLSIKGDAKLNELENKFGRKLFKK